MPSPHVRGRRGVLDKPSDSDENRAIAPSLAERDIPVSILIRNASNRTIMRFQSLIPLSLLLLCACAANQPVIPTSKAAESAALPIAAGEQAYVEVIIEGGKIVGAKKVNANTNPNTTLTFNFMKGDGGKSMMLSVKNPLANSIKYHIDMVDYKGKLHNTSSCPVMAGLSVFESWPHPIPEIRVSNIHIAADNEKVLCIY